MFTEAELNYLEAQMLGRVATQHPNGTLQVSPAAFAWNAEKQAIDVSGAGLARSRKYRNVAANGRASIVIDDVPSVDPIRVRCLEIRGRAEAVPDAFEPDGHLDGAVIRIFPQRIISFGVDDPDHDPLELKANNRDV
ncbi:PPOX class F420-dependent oxidoreductase [Amycolatopsis benzoatilytica]|uniref:PPOX class F420-dependent oxidoreductase n=1 Tax=Amycolatopsis benzoatilytica TaxID=346045 RepID=UPI00035F16EF|nr:PPOX class F420-dependent oxidoreductase [Amycolatopsis benzoatilytica]